MVRKLKRISYSARESQVIRLSTLRCVLDAGGSKGLSGKRKLKMNHEYKAKNLESKTQRELYQNPPNHLAYEPESTPNKEYILRDIYAGIDLFDRLIREAKEELEDKKLHYRAYQDKIT